VHQFAFGELGGCSEEWIPADDWMTLIAPATFSRGVDDLSSIDPITI